MISKYGPNRDKAGDWPEDFSHENGNYFSECRCGRIFVGHKRRPICKVCDSEFICSEVNFGK